MGSPTPRAPQDEVQQLRQELARLRGGLKHLLQGHRKPSLTIRQDSGPINPRRASLTPTTPGGTRRPSLSPHRCTALVARALPRSEARLSRRGRAVAQKERDRGVAAAPWM